MRSELRNDYRKGIECRGGRIVVLHTTPVWLPLTHSWLYNNVKWLNSTDVGSHIISFREENSGTFGIPNLHIVRGHSWLLRGAVGHALKMAMGIRIPRSVAREAKRICPDIWHSHGANWAWHNMRVAKDHSRLHMLSVYGADISSCARMRETDVRRRRVNEVLRSVDCVLCEGPAMRRKLIGMGCKEAKIIIHHLGVDLEYFKYQPLTLGDRSERLKILLSGRFVEKKGFQIGLKALQDVADLLPLSITIIGDSNTGEGGRQKREILELSKRLSAKCTVSLMGMQPYPEFRRMIYEHHVYMAPSITAADGDDEGGSPVALTEAGAAGAILIGSRHCDIPELIEDNKTGFLVEEGDVRGICEAVHAISRQRDQLDEMRRNCRQKVESLYDAHKQSRQLTEIYKVHATVQ